MSLYDYEVGQRIVLKYGDDEFYGLIQACMRLADTDNLQRLKIDWPDVWNDLERRYNAPGGVLPEDEEEELHTRIVSNPAPGHEEGR